MYHHILIPTDGTELSAGAVEMGMSLAKHVGAKVTVLTVVGPAVITGVPEHMVGLLIEYKQAALDEAESRLEAAKKQAERFGVHCETVKIEHPYPHETIIETATSRGCDLIVMASHGRRGLSALILGSETTKVLTHSKLPVLVYR